MVCPSMYLSIFSWQHSQGALGTILWSELISQTRLTTKSGVLGTGGPGRVGGGKCPPFAEILPKYFEINIFIFSENSILCPPPSTFDHVPPLIGKFQHPWTKFYQTNLDCKVSSSVMTNLTKPLLFLSKNKYWLYIFSLLVFLKMKYVNTVAIEN